MSWILKRSEFKFRAEGFWGSTWFWWTLIICFLFGSNQPPVSLKKKQLLLSWLGKRWSSHQLLKQDLTCLSNASQGSFYLDFCCRECISCLLIKYSRLIIINYWQNRNLHNQTNASKEKKGSSVLLSHKIHLFLKFIEIDGISVIDVFHYLLIQIS